MAGVPGAASALVCGSNSSSVDECGEDMGVGVSNTTTRSRGVAEGGAAEGSVESAADVRNDCGSSGTKHLFDGSHYYFPHQSPEYPPFSHNQSLANLKIPGHSSCDDGRCGADVHYEIEHPSTVTGLHGGRNADGSSLRNSAGQADQGVERTDGSTLPLPQHQRVRASQLLQTIPITSSNIRASGSATPVDEFESPRYDDDGRIAACVHRDLAHALTSPPARQREEEGTVHTQKQQQGDEGRPVPPEADTPKTGGAYIYGARPQPIYKAVLVAPSLPALRRARAQGAHTTTRARAASSSLPAAAGVARSRPCSPRFDDDGQIAACIHRDIDHKCCTLSSASTTADDNTRIGATVHCELEASSVASPVPVTDGPLQ